MKAVVGVLNQGLAVLDESLAQVSVNDPAARLLNLDCGEVSASEFDAAMAKLRQRALNRAEIASSVDSDCTWRFAEAPTHVRVSSHALRQGAFNGQIWVFDDVSQILMEATKRLTASEQSYRLLEDNIGEVVCHIRDGRFVLISGAAEAALGAPAEHWINREVRDIIPPEDLPSYAARVETLRAGGTVKERVRITDADGVTHWAHMHAKPFHDFDGREDGVAAAFRLIDDLEAAALRDAEEARRQRAKADERYRRSMDNAAIGMGIISPDGRFEVVNNALCQLFGFDAETLQTKTWQELTAPEYLAADQKNVDNILDGHQDNYRLVKQYIRADGKRIWGDLSVSCVRNQDGRVEQLMAQIIDITAAVDSENRSRTLTERLRQQSDRLRAELESAAAYMSSVMPRGLTGKVRVTSRYLPSQELGGDCFDYAWIDDNHLMVYLIDVSGHGIEPALLSVSVHNMLRSGSFATETLLAPDAVLAELNRLFQMDQQGYHYFTIWYGIYEASTRTLRYTGAGAPPALAFTRVAGNGLAAEELATRSAPVGMFEDTVFTSSTYQVPPASRILIYSDGASEIALPGNRLLTLAEFKEVSTRLAGSPDWSLDELVEGLRSLTARGGFDDDFSVIELSFD